MAEIPPIKSHTVIPTGHGSQMKLNKAAEHTAQKTTSIAQKILKR